MKHHFLLDENVLHHAVKGVDQNDNQDSTCAELVLRIASNCHRVVVNQFLYERYRSQIQVLMNVKSGILQPLYLLNQLILNSLKFVWQYENLPSLPSGCFIPTEDVDVVRSALISHPIFVTSDEDLRKAINDCEALHLRAIHPTEALILARDS